MSIERHDFRRTQRRLHKFIRRIHDAFGERKKKQWLVAQAEVYIDEAGRAFSDEEQWEQAQRRYFEQTIFARGKGGLRDVSAGNHPEHCVFHHYLCRLSPTDLDALPPAARRGIYFDRVWSNSHKTWDRQKFSCIHGDDCATPTRRKAPQRRNQVSFRVSAWTPPELVEFDETRKSRLPLPPELFEREYTIAEACFALVALHDADGAFERFISPRHPLYRRPEFLNAKATIHGIGNSRLGADNDWVVSLEPLLERALATYASRGAATPKRVDKPGRKSDTDHAKDRRIAEAWFSGQYSTYSALAQARGNGETGKHIRQAIDRNRKRSERSRESTTAPDKSGVKKKS